jgi:thiol:disulfide interchange protein DsbD
VSASGQKLDPAKWSLTLAPAAAPPASTVTATLEVTLEEGWYLYSPTTPPGGPNPTRIEVEPAPGLAAYRVYQNKPVVKFDPNFNLDTEVFSGQTAFLIELVLAKEAAPGPLEVRARVRYQACTEKLCLPPVRKTAAASLRIDPAAPAAAPVIPAGYAAVAEMVSLAPQAEQPPPAAPAPVERTGAAQAGWIPFVGVAFGFGLAAIFTPCVFPMIPITVSFFLRQQAGGRRDSVMQALLFCLGIVILFTGLGLATTAILGPFGVVQLGSNPWVNGFIALVFLVFGLSLLGAFELTLPSGLLTRLDRASQRGGYAGTLIMGLTFSLTAFACVGPFVGTLLAASIQSGGLQPLIGMFAFASGLALPFFLLALFPSYLQRLPRSGGWLARVKVVLGFVILAAMFKYLSNVDQVMRWEILTRERFLAVWIVLFALAGLYLLGFLRLEGVDPAEKLGLTRLLVGAAFLIFSLSLVPGMFGGRLGELDAYVPPPRQTAGGLASTADSSPAWLKNQLDEALNRARAEGKLVFVNFTGYACTNCHWMKANMFTRPEIAAALKEFVLVELYTDGADAASERNQQLQQEKFSTIAIPYYAILDADQNVRATFAGLTRNPEEFLAFLRSAARPAN